MDSRFTKSVYPGATIHVKFTVKASSSRLSGKKVDQAPAPKRSGDGAEKKPKTADSPKGADIASGIVKFLVDPASAGQVVVDETGETVAIATILTMVRKLDQN